MTKDFKAAADIESETPINTSPPTLPAPAPPRPLWRRATPEEIAEKCRRTPSPAPSEPLRPEVVAEYASVELAALMEETKLIQVRPSLARVRHLERAAKHFVETALARAVAAHYGPEEAKLLDRYGSGYRLPEQRAWLRELDVAFSDPQPFFWEAKERYLERLAEEKERATLKRLEKNAHKKAAAS